eukprot:scaffold136017_cov30-Tisochrysis_lutea.AAC.2
MGEGARCPHCSIENNYYQSKNSSRERKRNEAKFAHIERDRTGDQMQVHQHNGRDKGECRLGSRRWSHRGGQKGRGQGAAKASHVKRRDATRAQD